MLCKNIKHKQRTQNRRVELNPLKHIYLIN